MTAPRSCGTCTLCCKVLGVEALQKPEGTWCTHCDTGRGCRIYATRPDECRTFGCLWLVDPNFPDKFKPDRSKVVFYLALEGRRVGALVDQKQPNAWRAPEMHALLRRMAREAVPRNRQVVVHSNGNLICIMPDHDVELGPFQPGKRLVYRVVGEGSQSQIAPVLEDDV